MSDIYKSFAEQAIGNREKKATEEGVCYVTELVKCSRKAYRDRVSPPEYDDQTLRRFKAGDLLEEGFTAMLRQIPGIYVIGTQWRAYYKDDKVEIHGRIDVLTQHNNKEIVAHEVKSVKDYSWSGEPYLTHRQQLQFYMGATGLEYGEINYISKKALVYGDKNIDERFLVEQDPETFQYLVEKAHILIDALDNEIEPEPNPQEYWECGYCGHKRDCPKYADENSDTS